ncbi:MAG: hypothetical protein AAFN04_07555 [Pseudomonadota bacterium]
MVGEGNIGFLLFLAIVATGLIALGINLARSRFLIGLSVTAVLLCVLALLLISPVMWPSEPANFAAGLLVIYVGIPLAYASCGMLLLVLPAWISRFVSSNRSSHPIDQIEEEN